MERRIQEKVNCHIKELERRILEACDVDQSKEFEDKFKSIFDEHGKLNFTTEDFSKRKRVKNAVPMYERCCALRANGEQCTRRRKGDSPFCGTHMKNQPYGVVSTDGSGESSATAANMIVGSGVGNVQQTTEKKITVVSKDIQGIIYFIDDNHNVYDPHDIHMGKTNPRIIAKWEKTSDGKYKMCN